MDSLAGTQSLYEEADDSRRKRTRLIVAVVLIALALAAAWYAFSASTGGAAGADGAAASGAGALSLPRIPVFVPLRQSVAATRSLHATLARPPDIVLAHDSL